MGQKNFNTLCTLRTDSSWQIIFYSLSSKTEASLVLDNSKKDGAGLPQLLYRVEKTDHSASTSLTTAQMKQQGGWAIFEYPRPETADSEGKKPANPFTSWKMSMSQVVQKFIDRAKGEQITGAGLFITIAELYTPNLTPYVSMYWENGSKRSNFYVEPVTLKAYDKV